MHHSAHVAADQEIPHQPPGFRRIYDANPTIRSPDREDGVGGIVEEDRVASIRYQQRHAHVGAGAVPDMRVPELSGNAEPIESWTTLAETVEVLLARELERGLDTATRRAVAGPVGES